MRSWAALAVREPLLARTVMKVHRRHLSMIPLAPLSDLAKVASRLRVDGAILEAGAALGGSAIVLGRAKERDRALYVFDVFGRIPPPSERDGQDARDRFAVIESGQASGIRGGSYYGYHTDLLGEVDGNLRSFGLEPPADSIRLIQGRYEDSMKIGFPVALAHVDCDWYDSVMTCLSRIEPWLVPGGRLVIDDYWAWSGCQRAVDDFFADRDGFRFERHSRLHVVKEVPSAR